MTSVGLKAPGKSSMVASCNDVLVMHRVFTAVYDRSFVIMASW